MAKRKTLPSIRITSNTAEQIVLSLSKFNETSLVPLSLQDFRRLSYLYLSEKIIKGEELNIRLER